MMKARCRDCGAPVYTRIFRKWNDDGTVTGRLSKGIRICHIEAGEITAMVEGVSERIGYPIDRIVVEGERKASRGVTDETFSAGHGALGLVGRSWGGSPVSLGISMDISRAVGNGSGEILDHRRGERLLVKFADPFCVPVVVGETWGSFEALYRITAEAEWEEADGGVVIDLKKSSDGMVEQHPDRLALKKMATRQGRVRFDRCPRCGVPREVTHAIEWDLERGIVTNRKTGRREVTIMVESVNAVIHELASELGEGIPEMVMEIEEGYVASVTDGNGTPGGIDGYRSLLSELTVMGMGNPVDVSLEDGTLKVAVDNPFCEPLLAGRVGGYYEVLEGVKPTVTWTPDTAGTTVVEARNK